MSMTEHLEEEALYYIVAKPRSRETLAFWRANMHGYTRDIKLAAKVTMKQALQANVGEDDGLVEVEKMDVLARLMVCVQEFEYGKGDIPV